MNAPTLANSSTRTSSAGCARLPFHWSGAKHCVGAGSRVCDESRRQHRLTIDVGTNAVTGTVPVGLAPMGVAIRGNASSSILESS
jgi:hypothetical protein